MKNNGNQQIRVNTSLFGNQNNRNISFYSAFSIILILLTFLNVLKQQLLFLIGGAAVGGMVLFIGIYLLIGRSSSIPEEKTHIFNKMTIWGAVFLFVYFVVYALYKDYQKAYYLPILGSAVNKQTYVMFFNLFYIVPFYIIQLKTTKKEKNKVCNILLIVIIANCLINFVSVNNNDDLQKVEAYSEEGGIYTLGFELSFVSSMIIPLLLYRVELSKNWKKILYLGLVVLIIFSVYSASYMIAIISCFVSIILYFFNRQKRKTISVFLFVVFIGFIAYLVMSGYLTQYMSDLAKNTDNDFIKERLEQMVDYFNGTRSSQSRDLTTVRFKLYKETWSSFLGSPVFGNAIFKTGDFKAWDHTVIIDYLAVGGLVLIVPFINFLRYSYKYSITYFETDSSKKTLKTVYYLFFFMALINPCYSTGIFVMLLVCCPLLIQQSELNSIANLGGN